MSGNGLLEKRNVRNDAWPKRKHACETKGSEGKIADENLIHELRRQLRGKVGK